MGWLDRIFGSRKEDRSAQTVAQRDEPSHLPPYCAVIDVETTGLSPALDRVIEIAVVRIDQCGTVVDEWSTRLNPEGPIGASHIHGITDADVAHAPLFRDVATAIVPYIQGLPIAAHNARFDLAFLRAEFRRAGWDVPELPAYCTLDSSHRYMPHLARRRLGDCCEQAGIRLDHAHSALGDARAAAALLRHYLQGAGGLDPHHPLASAADKARMVTWPVGPTRPPVPAGSPLPQAQAQKTALIAQLTPPSLLEVLDEGAPDGSLTYIETLLEALEDGVIAGDEATALQDLADVYQLTGEDLARVHHAVLLSLAHKALDDGHVSRDEREQLQAVAKALSLPNRLVPDLIAQADSARAARLSANLGPLPADWALGEPLRVGDKVAFTGAADGERARLERRAEQLGVRVMGNVSRLTSMLVSDGGFAGGKLAKATELNVRIVTPSDFAILLEHLQPARRLADKAKPAVRASPAREESATTAAAATAQPAVATPAAATAAPATQTSTSPREIRAWAAANGYVVGRRGRLPAELVQAYENAMQQHGQGSEEMQGRTPASV